MELTGAWHRTAEGAGLAPHGEGYAPSIFARMSGLAATTGAVNLGQGFPDEDGPAEVLAEAAAAITRGENQYPPGRGTRQLREAIATHRLRFTGELVDPDTEVLVTAGATEALAASLLALVGPGDEVVTWEPSYDAYGALIALAGGRQVTVPLGSAEFGLDLDRLRAAVSDRTRVIIVNDPHNPTGTLLDDAARAEIVRLAEKHDVILLTDEVYEHLVFDGRDHTSISTVPGARERTITVSSAGKTFNTTGWKIGWAIAPAALLDAVLTVKQFLTYVNGSPFQPAIAVGLGLPDRVFADAAARLQSRRDLLVTGLREAGFAVTPPAAGYFAIADAAPLGYRDAEALCDELPRLAGVVGIPVTAFVGRENRAPYRSLIRFAFCKRPEVIEAAVDGLTRLPPGPDGR
ncbi:aminotransferase class I/II-fold pyridoxal phosphate-dependent enzyme [Mycetocola reblochoni]|uniref:Aspartate aminotransferase n=2 Tax=Mycetocola reblochoni TaxID=331618 RepID=A0A1R4J9G4_9MICO|nr:aminotransferase class I/II-fold pyridoxal phosphate-dependent enzyme [Mycetocola reblochoni]RLP70096.1 aminotransferase class I/II-fold pyridoxal phosphate-dependent enzyme [Mycetocola reblochoni]SJN28554.1 Aspartate aminotransferase [Mycetocola reblochoni REB411]